MQGGFPLERARIMGRIINGAGLGTILLGLLVACTLAPRENQEAIRTAPLSVAQESAFDAWNDLQTSMDERNRLYSTFANSSHSFCQQDSSFDISQSELRFYMHQFLGKHAQRIEPEKQERLINLSVLAQEQYTVRHCVNMVTNVDYAKGLPMSGIWVIPDILGLRDVILVW